jgi:hypothetical protein
VVALKAAAGQQWLVDNAKVQSLTGQGFKDSVGAAYKHTGYHSGRSKRFNQENL